MLTDDLLELQRIDTATDQLAHQRQNLPARAVLTEAQAGVARNRSAIATLIARQRELTETVEAAERKGAELTTKRERLQAQLKTVISPREAEALMHELDTLAVERDALDDAELEALEEQSGLLDDLSSAHGAEPRLDAAAAAAGEVLTAAETEIDEQLAALTVERSEVVARIDGGALADYERRRAHFKGVAVARLEGRRCSGCNLDLSTSEFEEVRSVDAGEITDCPQCGRILVP